MHASSFVIISFLALRCLKFYGYDIFVLKIAFYLNKSKSTIKKSSMIDKKGFCIIYISFKIISTFVRDFWPRWSTSVIRRRYTLLFLLSFLPISNDMLFQPYRCIHLPCHRIHNVVLSHTKHDSIVIFILKDTHFHLLYIP